MDREYLKDYVPNILEARASRELEQQVAEELKKEDPTPDVAKAILAGEQSEPDDE
jgi:hypothetical protein